MLTHFYYMIDTWFLTLLKKIFDWWKLFEHKRVEIAYNIKIMLQNITEIYNFVHKYAW